MSLCYPLRLTKKTMGKYIIFEGKIRYFYTFLWPCSSSQTFFHHPRVRLRHFEVHKALKRKPRPYHPVTKYQELRNENFGSSLNSWTAFWNPLINWKSLEHDFPHSTIDVGTCWMDLDVNKPNMISDLCLLHDKWYGDFWKWSYHQIIPVEFSDFPFINYPARYHPLEEAPRRWHCCFQRLHRFHDSACVAFASADDVVSSGVVPGRGYLHIP